MRFSLPALRGDFNVTSPSATCGVPRGSTSPVTHWVVVESLLGPRPRSSSISRPGPPPTDRHPTRPLLPRGLSNASLVFLSERRCHDFRESHRRVGTARKHPSKY